MEYTRPQRALGALAILSIAGCANPSLFEWEDPLYRRTVEKAESERADAAPPSPMVGGPSMLLPHDGAMSVDDAIRFAILNHPELRRLAYQVRAAAARESQARLYPNPSFVFEAEALGSDAGSAGETAYLIEQEFITAGKRAKAGAVAESDRIEAQSAFRAHEFAVATLVRRRFVQAVAAERRYELQSRLTDLSRQLLETANARVDAGAATEPDRLRAEVVAEQASMDLAAADSARNAARASLAAAMGLEQSIQGDLVNVLQAPLDMPDRERVIELTLERNQRVDQARNAIERAERAHTLAKASATPNIVAAIGPRYSDPDDETTLDVGASIEIPIIDRNQGEIAATLAERIAAGAALGSTKLELIAAVSDAWSAFATAQATIRAYETSLLPKAERNLALTREAYEAGKVDYLRLLDAQQSFVRSETSYVDALETLHETAAILDGLMQLNAPWRDVISSGDGDGS